jgi:hypothetical protein
MKTMSFITYAMSRKEASKGSLLQQMQRELTILLSFEEAKPQIFRLGDIVEVQMSFVCVPLKEQNFKMLTVLHSIALIDSTFTQVSTRNQA